MTPLTFAYINHRRVLEMRRVIPTGPLFYGKTQWHDETQWLLPAYDLDRQEHRTFAVAHMRGEDFNPACMEGRYSPKDVEDAIAKPSVHVTHKDLMAQLADMRKEHLAKLNTEDHVTRQTHKQVPLDTPQSKGGRARAAILTAEERIAQAKHAANTRWHNDGVSEDD